MTPINLYVAENAQDFAECVDELVLDGGMDYATLKEWVDFWPDSFKRAVWQRLKKSTRWILEEQREAYRTSLVGSNPV
jgi:hypothetical protein